MTVSVVGCALVGVRKHAVGFAGFLEALLGFGIARVAVGVVLHRQLAICGLQFGFTYVPGDPEDFIVVCFAHWIPGSCHGYLFVAFFYAAVCLGLETIRTSAGRRRRSRMR